MENGSNILMVLILINMQLNHMRIHRNQKDGVAHFNYFSRYYNC